MRFIGDVHGRWLDYINIIHDPNNPCSESIQVGDFGIGFGQRHKYLNYITDEMNMPNTNHRFIRGNHDSPEACKNHPNYIEDGTCENGVMYIGGAFSIDVFTAGRTNGVDWWENEELSYPDLSKMISTYETYKPEVMVTHDIPDSIARHFFPHYAKNDPKNNSRTRNAFDTMFHYVDHRPRIWIFGHWHESVQKNVAGTDFFCLKELEHIEISI